MGMGRKSSVLKMKRKKRQAKKKERLQRKMSAAK